MLDVDANKENAAVARSEAQSAVTPPYRKTSDMRSEAQHKEFPCTQQHVLTVPASAWHAMQHELKELREESAETRRFLRAHLRLEHMRRTRAATGLQSMWRLFTVVLRS